MHEDDHVGMSQFGRLLTWLIPTLMGFALVYGGVGYVFADTAMKVGASIIAIVGIVLAIARWFEIRRQTAAATLLVMVSFILATLVLAVAQPDLAISYAVVPLLIALVVLCYAPNPHARWTLPGCAVISAAVLVIGEFSPITSHLPRAVLTGLRLSTLMANIIFALLLIQHMRQQLLAALRHSRAAHDALAAAHSALHEHAKRDALTGLVHRGAWEEVWNTATTTALHTDTAVGVLLMDIDHFKRVNDTFGHAAGDTVLRAVSHVLLATSRGSDWVCRYGGEEFVVLLSPIDLETAVARAEQLRQQISELRVQHQGQTIESLSISIGVAIYPQHGSTADAVVQAADAAMYAAKRAGRNRVCHADESFEHETIVV